MASLETTPLVEPAEPDLSSARFARELWGIAPPDSFVEWVFLQDRKTPEEPKAKDAVRSLPFRTRDAIENYATIDNQLQVLNRKIWNVHHAVNPRAVRRENGRSRNQDVHIYVALWADLDWHHGEEAVIRARLALLLEELRKLGIYPSVIVESGYGVHLYWLLDAPAPAAIPAGAAASPARRACAGLQDFCKIADPINDPRRVLRWPGTANVKIKGTPAPCRIIEASWQRYPLTAFADYMVDPGRSQEDVEDEKATLEEAATVKAIQLTLPSRDPKIEDLKRDGCDEGKGPYGGRHNAAKALAGHYASRLKTKGAIVHALTEWNRAKCRPPIDEAQVKGLVDFAWNQEQLKRAEAAESQKEEKAQGKKPPATDRGAAEMYFRGKEFLPEVLANDICTQHKLLATPEGDDGLGVSLYHYKDGWYQRGGEGLVVDAVRAILGDDTKHGRANDVKLCLRMSRRTPYDRVNARALELINVKNGMLEWRTGKLFPHDPSYLSTIQAAAEYDPAAKSDVLDKFLEAVLPKDEIPIFEEFTGHLLTPDTSFGKCLVAVGEGGNGKSTALKLLTGFLGKQNISNYSLHHISEERFSSAGLFGKLANFYDELQTKAIQDTATFKLIVTGDPIKAEEKGKAPFSFKPFCRLVFATNAMPRATDRSEAYFDRFIFVKFPNRIRGTAAVVRDYDEVLARTPGLLSALLNRAIAGLARLHAKNGFSPSPSSVEAIEEYRQECNSTYDFVQENCSYDDPTGWISRREFYEHYRVWCADYGRKPMSSRELAKTLKSMNLREVRHGDGRGFGGVSWRDGRPPETTRGEIAGLGRAVDERRSDLEI